MAIPACLRHMTRSLEVRKNVLAAFVSTMRNSNMESFWRDSRMMARHDGLRLLRIPGWSRGVCVRGKRFGSVAGQRWSSSCLNMRCQPKREDDRGRFQFLSLAPPLAGYRRDTKYVHWVASYSTVHASILHRLNNLSGWTAGAAKPCPYYQQINLHTEKTSSLHLSVRR